MMLPWSWPLTYWIWNVITSLYYPMRCVCIILSELSDEVLSNGLKCVDDAAVDSDPWSPQYSQFSHLCQIQRNSLKAFMKHCVHKNWVDRQPKTPAWRHKKKRMEQYFNFLSVSFWSFFPLVQRSPLHLEPSWCVFPSTYTDFQNRTHPSWAGRTQTRSPNRNWSLCESLTCSRGVSLSLTGGPGHL